MAAEELDLSFAVIEPKGREGKVTQAQVLDLSFLDEETKQRNGLRQINPNVPKEAPKTETITDDRTFIDSVFNMFTGDDRQTDAIQGLKEFDPKIPLSEPKKGFKTALGLLTSMRPEQKMQVLLEAFPKLQFFEDEKGNIVVDGTAEGQGRGLLNAPGFSASDARQLGFQIAAFTPAAKLASAGGGIISNSLKVGLGSAATQGAQDLVNQASRGEDVSIGNIDKLDTALVSAAGSGFQALFQALAKGAPLLRERIKQTGITDQIRNEVKQIAVKLGLSSDDITDDVIRQVVSQTDEAVSPEQAFATQGEKEFGIPLTKGQRSLDDAALSFEDRARSGLQGEGAQRVVRGFERKQQFPAISKARQQVESTLSRNRPILENVADAGASLRTGIQTAEQTAKAQVDDAFAQIGDAKLKAGQFQKAVIALKESIEGIEFINDPKLTPSTQGLIRRLDQLNKSLGVSVKRINGADEVTLTPIHIKQIESVRKVIEAFADTTKNNTDLKNITIIKKTFDDFLDDAVKNALFEGDDAALQALKQSRSLFKEYAQKFRERLVRTKSGRTLPDREGKFIDSIVSDNPTDEQIVNALFGASNFTSSTGQKMAQRFKQIIGPESDAWRTVKQAAFRRLIKTNKINGEEVISGQQTLKAVDTALEKNRSLLQEIFSNEEIGLIKRFALQVKRTQPDLAKSRENPSGSAQVAGKALADVVKRVSNVFVLSGDPTLAVTSNGVSTLRGLSSTGKAKSAVRPFQNIKVNPVLVGGGTGVFRENIAEN